MRKIIIKLVPLLLLQIFFSLVHSLTVAIFPLIEKWFIDNLSETQFQELEFLSVIALPLLTYLSLIIVNGLSQSGTRITEWRIGSRFTELTNSSLFSAFLRNKTIRNSVESAEVINILQEDVEALEEDYISAWLDFWTNLIVLLIFSGTIIMYLDWRVLLVIAFGSLMICFVPAVFSKILSSRRKKSISAQKDYLSIVLDLLRGKRQCNEKNIEGFENRHNKGLLLAQKSRFVYGKWRTISDTTADIGTEFVRLATMLVCLYLLFTNQMEIGGVFASIAFSTNFLAPIESMISSLNAVQSVGESKSVVEDYLKEDSVAVKDRKIVSDINRIELVDLVIDRDAFQIGPINETFLCDKHYLITGRNGIGKSSLLMALTGDLIYTGTVLIDGEATELVNTGNLIQLVKVDEHIFEGSLFDNLSYFGSIGVDERLVDEYLKVLDKKTRDRIMDCSNCSDLSSGEKQIIAVLRVLNLSPKVLILDEALSSIDVLNKHNVREFIKRRISGIIEVSHDISEYEREKTDFEFVLDLKADDEKTQSVLYLASKPLN